MSTRIDILGQRGGIHARPGGNVVIERKFPGILNNRMSESEWTTFCDNVDKAIEPIGPLKTQLSNRAKRMGMFMFGYFILVAILTSTRVLTNRLHYILPPLFILFLFVPFICSFRSFRNVAIQLNRVMADLEAVCSDESNKRPDVSFHVRAESYQVSSKRAATINYIECSVGSGDVGPSALEAGLGPGSSSESAFPVATPVVSGASYFEQLSSSTNAAAATGRNDRLAERLKELDGIKALISEEEYNTKRKEILDSI